MANIKSQKKRNRTNELARQRNASVKSKVKTLVKHAEDAIEAKDADRIGSTVKAAVAEIDKAASKGVIHQNSAARKKSTLQRKALAVSK
jgi:small subunit ribosomal protein S20